MPNVNCTVDNCEYWADGNSCHAKQIVIQNDEDGGFPPTANLGNLTATPADDKDDTCCQTFKMK